MPDIKVGTCCYCGSRAALELSGTKRHELACATCGAPLRRMKMLPKSSGGVTARAATPTHPKPQVSAQYDAHRLQKRPKKRKKSKGLGRKIFEELWDVVEDILD